MKEYLFDDGYKSLITKPIKYTINEKGCFSCTSHCSSGGNLYPQIKRGGKSYKLHRYVYELLVETIPDKLVVRHKCDNPLCFNKDHLELGTQLDNISDTISRNRNSNGSRNGNIKLNEDIVREILA